MYKIKSIKAYDDYTIDILLDNEELIKCDMTNRLRSIRFNELHNIALFKSAYIKNPFTISWSKTCELTIDEVLLMINKKEG